MNDLLDALDEVQEILSSPQGPKDPNQTPPAAAAAEQPGEKPKRERVRFDADQQAKVNELIREAQGRAGREARAEAERLRQELETLRASQQHPDTSPEAAAELAALKLEREAWQREKRDNTLTTQIRAALGDRFVAPDICVDLLRRDLTLGPDGNLTTERINPATFEPMTVDELVTNLASERPYLARGEVRGGAGSTESQRSTLTDVSREKLSLLFGKNSNARLANDLARRDHKTYTRLKAAAVKEGLI